MLKTWTNKGLAPDNETPDPTLPAGAAGAPGTTPSAPTREAKVITMQRGTLAKQMRGEREKGKQEVLTAIEARAQALGFKSVDEMFARQERDRRRAAQPAQPAQAQPRVAQPPRNASPAEMRRYQREIERRDRALEEERRSRIQEARRRKAAEDSRRALEAEMELKEIALGAGIRDTDYAIHLYTRHCASKSPEDLAQMNEEEFFKGLRERHPYLFGETVEPANTGNGKGNPAPPTPQQLVKNVVRNGKFDARNASKAEIAAHAKKLGLTMPG